MDGETPSGQPFSIFFNFIEENLQFGSCIFNFFASLN